ncbi:MAG: hypothetical protein ACOX6V_04070 [Patescibacteria group bacterium]|jgi:hypothetical protein
MVSRATRRHLFTRKHFSLCLAVISWSLFFYTLFFVTPSTWKDIYYSPFFVLILISISTTLAFFFAEAAVFLLVPMAIVTVLVLRLFGIRDWFNPVLIVGLTVTLIYFFTVKDENGKLKKNTSIKQSDASAQSKS